MTKKDEELLKLYGEFLSKFEFVCSRMRFEILCILYPDYNTQQKNFCEIMTEGLTADPIRRKFIALIIERYSRQSELYKFANKISGIFRDLIELRNSFAHGTAFIGEYDFIEETKKNTIVIIHPKIKRDQVEFP